MTQDRQGTAHRPRLLVLTQNYRPEPNFITADVAERLADAMDVTVVTAHPNYPGGRFYPGVRWWRIERELENGVTVWRVPFFPDHSLSYLRRALSLVSFAVMAGLVAPFVVRRPDTVWVYHGTFTTGLAALWFRWTTRARIVFTCADLWPESFVASGVAREGPLTRAMFRYNRTINRTADLLICCTKGALERFRSDGVPIDRLSYVPVWVDGISDLASTSSASGGDPFTIVYAGNLGPSQKLDTLISAASLLEKRGVTVRVDIFGTGACEAQYRQFASRLGTRNVHFRGRVSPAEAFTACTAASAQYIALQPSPLFDMTVPSKLYAAFAAGTPLLYGLRGEAARLAEECGGGVPFDVERPESLAHAIRTLMDLPASVRSAMQDRLTAHYRSRFARDTLLEQYVAHLVPPALASHARYTGATASTPKGAGPAAVTARRRVTSQ